MAAFTVKSPKDIRDDFLRTIRMGLIKIGVASPNVSPGSEFDIEARAISNELTVLYANIQTKADDLMPDTATGTNLDRWATQIGLSRRTATGASGSIIYSTSAPVLIATGEQLIDTAGLRYAVTTGGIYDDGDRIPIAGVDTGTETNLAEDDIVRWSATPPFAQPEASVASPGLANGVADEDDETLRGRVLDRMSNPPSTGNAVHVAGFAEQSDGRVQKAFVYPAYRGPGTLSVAVTATPTATNKSREVDATVLTTIVSPYVTGQLPEHVQVDVTTVVDMTTDVSIGLSLPAPPNASPPGPGGGWLDGSPWPVIDNSSVFFATVTVVTNTTSIALTAVAARNPIAGSTRIQYVSHTGTDAFTIYTATVLTCAEAPAGTFTITLDAPLVGVAVGDYIFPASERAASYATALLTSFAAMGPAEKRAIPFSREYRRPQPSLDWPASLGPVQLRAISNSGDEVLDTQWLYRTNSDATVSGGAGLMTPAVQVVITDAPKIFTPRKLGFYQLP